MKYKITRYSICVPLSAHLWKKLQARDEKNFPWLNKRLEEAGAMRVDFNGHFGRNLLFDVEKLEAVSAVTTAFQDAMATRLDEIPPLRR